MPIAAASKTFSATDYTEEIPGRYDYYSVSGDEIHEVAVGPVHAGVIEPGHFRFNCIGERVLNLEIQLGYQPSRGRKICCRQQPPTAWLLLPKTPPGTPPWGTASAMPRAMEALSGIQLRSRPLRLSAPSVWNWNVLPITVGDLGALSGDVAFFAPGQLLRPHARRFFSI